MRSVQIAFLLLSLASVVEAQNTAGNHTSASSLETSVAPQNFEKTQYKGRLDVSISGRNIDDEFLKAASGTTFVASKFEATYSSLLSFNLNIAGSFTSGNSKSFYTEDGKSGNSVFLDEASMNLKPGAGFEFRVGAMGTKINPIQSAMSDNTFISTIQKFEYSSGNLKLGVSATESIPSSGTVTRGLIDDGPNPYFVTGTVFGDFVSETLKTKLRMAGTRYEFGNLSSNVASDSVLIGNSPQSFEGIGKSARYIIRFAGIETAAAIEIDWTSKIKTKFKASNIRNDQISGDRAQGSQAAASLSLRQGNYTFVPSYGVFIMGADVTPATYTSLGSRYHNREGYNAELRIELDKQKLSFSGRYTRANVVSDNPYMSDREIYNLGVEAKYDIF